MIRVAAALSVALLCAVGVTGAPEPEVYLEHDWYETEVVVFSKLDGSSFEGTEQVELTEPRTYPRLVWPFALTDDERRGGLAQYTIDDLDSWNLLVDAERWASFTAETSIAETVDLSDPESWEARPTWLWPTEAELDAANSIAPGDELEIELALEPPTEILEPQTGPVALQTLESPIDEAPPPTPIETVETAFREYEQRLLDSSYRWSAEGLELRAPARRLVNNGYRVVHHGKWLQPVPERGAEVPMLLQVGEARDGGLFEAEGLLSVTLARYLHFYARVWLDLSERSGLPWENEIRYAQLDERRRMRSDEIHYLDHPQFGIFVRIMPVEVPEDLLSLLEALDREGENAQ